MTAAAITSKSFDHSFKLLPPPLSLFDSYAHLGSLRRLAAPLSPGVCYTPRQVSDGESSIREQDVQNPNQLRGSSEPYRIDTTRLGHSDPQLPNWLSCNDFPPLPALRNQVAHNGVSHHLEPRPLREPGIQMILDPSVYGNSGDGIKAFVEDQICENGPRPDRRPTDQENYIRGTNSPFDCCNVNDVQFCNPNLFRSASHSQLPHVSPQGLAFMQGTHANWPFEYPPSQTVGEFRRIPAIEIAQGNENRSTSPKKWPCHYDGCNKRYQRRQEVKRHIKDKHEIPPKCFICGFKWTRAVNIRKHLVFEHQDYFTEEERQEIGLLKGLNNTVDFLEKWRFTRFWSSINP